MCISYLKPAFSLDCGKTLAPPPLSIARTHLPRYLLKTANMAHTATELQVPTYQATATPHARASPFKLLAKPKVYSRIPVFNQVKPASILQCC